MSEDLDDVLGDEAADSDAGGDDISLDDDLEAMMGDDASDEASDAGGGDAGGEGGGEGLSLDGDLEAMLGDDAGEGDAGGGEGGGEGLSLDGDLEAMLGDDAGEGDAGGGGGEGAAAAPPPIAAGDGIQSSRDALTSTEAVNLDFLLDVELHCTFEVGRSQMMISDLLTLGQGSVVELHRLVGEELDLLVNGKLIAKGEVVVVNEKFGCRVTEIIAPEDRIKHLAQF